MFTCPGIHKVQMFEEISSKIALAPHASVPPKARLMVGLVVPTILLFKLQFREGTVIYNP